MARKKNLGFLFGLLAFLILFSALFIYVIGAKESTEPGSEILDDESNTIFSVLNRNEKVFCEFDSGTDSDEDGAIDACDNCPDFYNPEQEDEDFNGVGDACEFLGGERERRNGGGSDDEDDDEDDDDEDDDDDEEIECRTNSDCGAEVPLDEPFCSDNNRDVLRRFRVPVCNNPGREDSFCTNQIEIRHIQTCEHDCLSGMCGQIVCRENSDCGEVRFIDEPFCSATNVVSRLAEVPVCNNRGSFDSFCSTINQTTVVETCSEICFEGACSEIMCRASSECGENGFVGQPFCVGDDVYQNFTEHTCLNPGSANSACSERTNSELRQECPFACFDGECIRCNENSDCNDNNANTNDICAAPGTSQSRCDNNPITFQCDDRIDNDNDGFIDFPADPGCSSRTDNSELPVNLHQCNDRIDNDGDSFIDMQDPACSNPFDNSEAPFNVPQCDDELDNDNDGRINYPADPQCSNRLDNDESQ